MQEEIQAVWNLRNQGKIADAYAGYVALCGRIDVAMRLSPGEKLARLRASGMDERWLLDFLLLEPSFLRNELKLAEAERCVEQIEQLTADGIAGSRYALSFQKGLNALVRSDFSRAFDCFLQAEHQARDRKELVGARYNLILSMEDLGLDTGPRIAHLEADLRKLDEGDLERFYSGKLDALRATDFYKRGDLESLSALARTAQPEDRLVYFLAWIAGHPLYRLGDIEGQEERFIRNYAERGGRWLNGYRLRTLRGLLIDADLGGEIKVSEKIHRLSLWTWRWLLRPSPVLLDRLFHLKADIHRSVSQSLTYEDFQMLENSVRWLALFSHSRSREAEGSLCGVSYSLGRSVVPLEYERLTLDYFFARRNGREGVARDTYLAMREHPARVSGRFLLPQLVEAAAGEGKAPAGWESLSVNLLELFPKDRSSIGCGVVVNGLDRSLCRVRNGELEERVYSESLVALCLLLKEKEVLEKAEVLRTCFGLTEYDSLIHDPKLANCLTRANRLLDPFVRLKTKGSQVIASPFQPEKLLFEGCSEHSVLLSRQREPVFLLKPSPPPLAPEEVMDGFLEDWKTREDYERLLRVSKSTATRRLNGWFRKRLLLKKGRGKNCRYKMLPALQKLLRGSSAR